MAEGRGRRRTERVRDLVGVFGWRGCCEVEAGDMMVRVEVTGMLVEPEGTAVLMMASDSLRIKERRMSR